MNREQGLTLVELVVVAFLVAVLSAILYGSLAGIIRTRDRTEELRSADRTAHYLMGRICMEINSRALVPLNTASADDNLQSSANSAIPTYLLSESKRDGEFDSDTLRFVSAKGSQALVGMPSNFGIVEVEYRLENDSSSSSDASHPARLLIREETPAGVSVADTINKRRITVPLADDVVSLNFRFMKAGQWQDGWNETTTPLPEMIEITLGIRGPNGSVEMYRTALPVTQRAQTATQTSSRS